MSSQRTTPNPPSRYLVGIDLGTTNSAMTFVDTSRRPWHVQTFAVPQLVAPAQIEVRETLPSFYYQPAASELGPGSMKLPWSHEEPRAVVGLFACNHGAKVPGRLVSSAKSWLCHTGVDRTSALLPWHGAPDVDRLSPVEASAQYLKHFAEAWDAQHPSDPLKNQDIVLTLPASFDEVARELTVKAAAQAGLPRVVLIEEPQAAFYAWLDAHTDDWEQQVEPGQKILVCDIGGGTTDFTLIRVRRGEGGKVQFHRVAVGDHLILGGDNLDLALAHHLEKRLTEQPDTRPAEAQGINDVDKASLAGAEKSRHMARPAADDKAGRLDARQWGVLVRICRRIKESLLGDHAPERLTVNLPGTGTRLIGGGRRIEVTSEEVRQVLVEGFFPVVGLDEKPKSRRSGFQEFGLPYAPDPAVTRWLAAFLTAHRLAGLDKTETQTNHDPARPDIVLLNGGVFESPVLRDRILDVLRNWFRGKTDWEPLLLENERLDLAVARGAAYYGMVRRGVGVRIAAGLARTYYIGVEGAKNDTQNGAAETTNDKTAAADIDADIASGILPSVATEETASNEAQPMAVCLVPAGVEPGQDIDLTKRRFDLLVSEPVEFPLYVSSTRLTDPPGELVPVDRERMTPLPPIRTVLRTRKKGEAGAVSVLLHARLTEIGTLDLWCSEADGRRSWRLQFDVRSATQTDIAAHESQAEAEGYVDEPTWQECHRLIERTFGPDAQDKPSDLVKNLSRAIGTSRNQWPTSLLRRLWEALMDLEAGRQRSEVHEARWLNLLGFSLRPGYGLAVDDWRVAQTWTAVQGRIKHPGPMCRMEGWILWRRIGGGLLAGQQQAIAEPLLALARGLHRQLTTGKRRGGDATFNAKETAEVWRLLGSLELLGSSTKIELGSMLLDILPKRTMEPVRPAIAWALGRIGARQPLYGPLNTVVPAEVATQWLERLMDTYNDNPGSWLAAMQMARRMEDRYRDIGEKTRGKVARWLESFDAPTHFVELVARGGQLDREEQGLVFGESLPKGLRIG